MINNLVSSIHKSVSKQPNWMAEKSKLSSPPSSVGVKLEKIKYDPERIAARKRRSKCCGR